MAENSQAANRQPVWFNGRTVTWLDCVELNLGLIGNILRVRTALRYLLVGVELLCCSATHCCVLLH